MKEQTQNPAQTLKNEFPFDLLIACAKWPLGQFECTPHAAWNSYPSKMAVVFDHFIEREMGADNPVYKQVADNVLKRNEAMQTHRKSFQTSKALIIQTISQNLQKECIADMLSEMPQIVPIVENDQLQAFDIEHYKSFVDLYQNRLSRSKPVRYFMGLGLSESVSLALYESVMEQIITDMKGDQVHVMKEPEDPDSWEYIYSAPSDFYSCMEGNDSVRAYANNEGCTLFYTTEDGKRFTGQKMTGRCLVNTKRKVYGRVYGDSGLKGWLDRNGYTYARDPLEGVKVHLEEYRPETNQTRQAFLMPYIDLSGGVGLNDEGEVIFSYPASGKQHIQCDNTNGYAMLNLIRSCSHCDKELHLNNRAYRHKGGLTGVCQSCFNDYYAFDNNGELINLESITFVYGYNGEVKALTGAICPLEYVQLANPERAYCNKLDKAVYVTHISRDAIKRANEGCFGIYQCRLSGKVFTERNGDYYAINTLFYGDNNKVLGEYGHLILSVYSKTFGDYIRVLSEHTVTSETGRRKYYLEFEQIELDLI